jgi:LacI family transcriptional regulator
MRQKRIQKSNDQNKVTIRDVSRLAGVSTATVSRVLSDYDSVSAETRELVFSAVKTLNYQINRAASNLRKRSTSKIGLVITDIQNPFFGSVTRGIEKITTGADYTLLLGNSDENPEQESKLIAQLLAEDVAGIILVPTSADCAIYDDLRQSNTPFVIIDRIINNCQDVDFIKVDGYSGSESAVNYFVGLGHKHIAFIGGLSHLSVMQERLKGYRDAMSKSGLPISECFVREGNNRQSGGYEAMKALLSEDKMPTAVLIANNLMTLGGLQAIHERNIRIPEQISLIGFDDMDWAPSLDPPLSVVAQPAFEMGEMAATVLMKRIKQPDLPPQQIILKTKLIIRASCKSVDPLKSS